MPPTLFPCRFPKLINRSIQSHYELKLKLIRASPVVSWLSECWTRTEKKNWFPLFSKVIRIAPMQPRIVFNSNFLPQEACFSVRLWGDSENGSFFKCGHQYNNFNVLFKFLWHEKIYKQMKFYLNMCMKTVQNTPRFASRLHKFLTNLLPDMIITKVATKFISFNFMSTLNHNFQLNLNYYVLSYEFSLDLTELGVS